MQRLRAARAIAEHYKALDPETMISEFMIRRLMDEGKLPIIKNGTKKLTSLEAVDEYLNTHLGGNSNG